MKGVRKTNKKDRDRLVEENFSYAMKISNYYDNLVPDFADRMSLAAEGLLNAVETYDPGFGTKLETHIVTCVKRNMLAEYRYSHRSKRYCKNLLSLDSPTQHRDSDYDAYTLHDVTPDKSRNPLDQIIFDDTLDALHIALDDLPQSQREVIILRYLSGLNIRQKEVGNLYGKTQAWVSLQERQGISACRKNMEKFAN